MPQFHKHQKQLQASKHDPYAVNFMRSCIMNTAPTPLNHSTHAVLHVFVSTCLVKDRYFLNSVKYRLYHCVLCSCNSPCGFLAGPSFDSSSSMPTKRSGKVNVSYFCVCSWPSYFTKCIMICSYSWFIYSLNFIRVVLALTHQAINP